MVMNILSAIGLFFIQPTFLLGAITAIVLTAQRKKRERELFRVAINKYNDEIVSFFTRGLWIGLLGSVLIIGLGIPMTLEIVLLYQLFAMIGLIAGRHFIHPMFTLSLSVITAVGIERFLLFERMPVEVQRWYQRFNQLEWSHFSLIQNILLITTLITALTAVNIKRQKTNRLSPKLMKTKRGKKFAAYTQMPLWLIPLVVIIPGEAFTAFFDWWPLFSIGNEKYSFLILPLLGGLRYTVHSQVPKEASAKISKDLFGVSLVSFLCFAASFWNQWFSAAGVAGLFIGGLLVLLRHHLREKRDRQLYSPAEEGLKIIGIRPETPAEKMHLQVGESVVMCNDISIHSEDDFYRALAKNSVYCHLKVNGIDGEPRLTETAIYEDDPFGMGIVFLSN